MGEQSNAIELALRNHLLNAGSVDGWGYEPGRLPRLEPTCWALLALRTAKPVPDQVLARWPSRAGALVEHDGGTINWSFHALALTTRLRFGTAPLADLEG